MSTALRLPHSATPSGRPALGVVHGLAHFLRLALVLLLVADIIGTPFHRHHHDSGIDGSAVHAQLDGTKHAAHHVEEDQHELDFVHMVTTMRAELRASAPDACADSEFQDVALACAWALPGQETPAPHRLSRRESDTPLHRLHRSLPPAGRAPPLRA